MTRAVEKIALSPIPEHTVLYTGSVKNVFKLFKVANDMLSTLLWYVRPQPNHLYGFMARVDFIVNT